MKFSTITMNGKRNSFFELTVAQRMQHIVILVGRKAFQVAPELQYGFGSVVPTHHRSKLSGSKHVVVQTYHQKSYLGLALKKRVLVETSKHQTKKWLAHHTTSYSLVIPCKLVDRICTGIWETHTLADPISCRAPNTSCGSNVLASTAKGSSSFST